MKTLSIIALTFCVHLSIMAQTKIDGCCITLSEPISETLQWSNDSISFTFSPSEYFWDVTIMNHSSENVTCPWDDALFIINDISSKIIFDNTTVMLKNDPLSQSIIAPNTKIRKSILPLENFGSYATNPVFTKKMLKRSGERTVTLLIPIIKADEKSTYKFVFTINACN